MAATNVLAIDQGTTGTTVLVLDRRLAVRAKVNQEFRQIFPKPGWVEHDLEDIWGSTTATVQRALREAGLRGADIAAIGITNQRETTGLWERRSGRPLHHAIVWQDRRTADVCARLKAEGHEPRVREKTGLVLDPYFSATKLRWLLDNVKGAREKAEAGELGVRDHRQLPRVAAHRRRRPRDRRVERQPHAPHGPADPRPGTASSSSSSACRGRSSPRSARPRRCTGRRAG